MKFFYALIVFLLSTYLFFWLYAFVIPTPKLQIYNEAIAAQNSYEEESIIKAANLIKSKDKDELYYFNSDLDKKRGDAVLLYVLVAFATIFVIVILTLKKSYILFPLIASAATALMFVTVLWIFTDTIDKSVYLDIDNIKTAYSGLKAFQYLGVFLFLDLFILVFGMWYDL